MCFDSKKLFVWCGLLVAIAVCLLASNSNAQCSAAMILRGERSNDEFGVSSSFAGDVNKDGFGDIIVGAQLHSSVHAFGGRAYVYSGQTGELLYVFDGEPSFAQFGFSVSGAGDVDNDGYDDVIVGAISGRAYVFSGKTGDILYVFTGEVDGDQFGYSVSGANDVNNDGYDDVLIGARFAGVVGAKAGKAYVYSGFNGDLLYEFQAEGAGDNFGASVSSAGDVNNDNYADLLIGAVGNDSGGIDAGRVYIVSGKDGTILHTFTGGYSSGSFGSKISSAGDVDGDGRPDVIVGSKLSDPNGTNSGEVYVYSGRTGLLLHRFSGGTPAGELGRSVSGAGDVNNDGFADLLIGELSGNEVHVYSGATGERLYTIPPAPGAVSFGVSVSGVGDINKDGYADILAGSILSNISGGLGAGNVYIYYLGDSDGDGLDNYCDNCPNSFNPDQLDTNLNGIGDVCDCCSIPGDYNNDGKFNVTDLLAAIDRVFAGGVGPVCQDQGDSNGDNVFNIIDVTYDIARIFSGGPAPVCGTTGS
jgi:FG-GAP repeat/FG-GAP-like repeat